MYSESPFASVSFDIIFGLAVAFILFMLRGAVRKSRRIRAGLEDPPQFIAPYGAWQGHNLGTTSMNPGDISKIEDDLRQAGRDE
jgi:hypothetical protein